MRVVRPDALLEAAADALVPVMDDVVVIGAAAIQIMLRGSESVITPTRDVDMGVGDVRAGERVVAHLEGPAGMVRSAVAHERGFTWVRGDLCSSTPPARARPGSRRCASPRDPVADDSFMLRSSSRWPRSQRALGRTVVGLSAATLVALADPAGATAVPASQVVASYPRGSVDAFAAGYGHAAWSVSGRRAGGTAVIVRDPRVAITTVRLRSGTVQDLRIVRGPTFRGVRDVAIVGMRCGAGDAPDCVPFALDSRVGFRQHIAPWVYPI